MITSILFPLQLTLVLHAATKVVEEWAWTCWRPNLSFEVVSQVSTYFIIQNYVISITTLSWIYEKSINLRFAFFDKCHWLFKKNSSTFFLINFYLIEQWVASLLFSFESLCDDEKQKMTSALGEMEVRPLDLVFYVVPNVWFEAFSWTYYFKWFLLTVSKGSSATCSSTGSTGLSPKGRGNFFYILGLFQLLRGLSSLSNLWIKGTNNWLFYLFTKHFHKIIRNLNFYACFLLHEQIHFENKGNIYNNHIFSRTIIFFLVKSYQFLLN